MFDTRPKWFNMQVLLTKISKREIPMKTSALLATLLAALALSACGDSSSGSGSAYRGESGYAVGFSSISDGGNWIIKGTATGNSRGHYGATAGVGYQW